MLKRVQQATAGPCGLRPDAPVVVGVSGGADSLALLDLLQRLGYPLVVAHYDHALRLGSEAAAQVVAAEARRRGLPFVGERGDVRGYAAAEGLSLEDAARRCRYAFLFRVAREHSAQAVAVAHTADDQAETLLLHLLRGAGSRGLAAMRYRTLTPWDARIPLVRPLLGVRRAETQAYCRAHGLPVQEDPTNRDPAYTPRNRLRLQVIPLLEQVNPRAVEALCRAAELLAEEDAYLQAEAARWWAQHAQAVGGGWRVDRPALLALPLALQRRVLRHFAPPEADFRAIAAALEAAHRPGGGPRTWIAGWRLWVEREALWAMPPGEAPPTHDGPQVSAPLTVQPGQPLALGQGWVLVADLPRPLAACREQALHESDPFTVWLDADTVAWPLILRPARPGERFAPLGLEGHTRLVHDLLAEAGVPWRLRAAWPLLADAHHVLWLPGVRPGHHARITPQTTRVVRLRLYKEEACFGVERNAPTAS